MLEFGLTEKRYLLDFVLENLDDKVEFFQDSKLHPMVRVFGDGFQQDWPVNSQRFLDLLETAFYNASMGDLIKKRECDFFLSQIREKCRSGERRFTHYEAEAAEENPIVQAVLCYVNAHEHFEGRTVVLLEILRDSQFAGSFPVAANNFSRRLKRSIEILRGYGVDVKIEHQHSGSYCQISRTESFAIEPDVILEQNGAGDDAQRIVTASSPHRHP